MKGRELRLYTVGQYASLLFNGENNLVISIGNTLLWRMVSHLEYGMSTEVMRYIEKILERWG
ncbi:hypothetical protein J15TS10_28670 [Paenibacillus woosongensis]|uniref:Uncharacterized protein n=1 Tax=Paenibacillus woosongensis TaxID=307580 RepID=A0ABQ4MSU2_9BACL|nr:hypothetical protein J15TS10_28670 [Paenibacillus woosongensis]